MMNLTMLSMMILLIITVLMMMVLLISKKSFMDREKSSPFECGFDPLSSPRTPFSLHFFLMAVIFLIFDVEIILILPITIITKYSMMTEWMLSSTMFMMILMLGLYHEWYNGMLEWAK
uniref:NADH-ubiquinone oxidoreductase chain 3 n=1 Tax=Cosmoscarta bispecularis TaxID=798355 RepID=A0A0U1YMD5_9HEMI|nr:NADH dehydrogenase subunit 3 [Cosmoscarta bispecularis]AZL35834.1 NADH dehydrogenase subunit 3 [Cosmoscarta bispecularis]QHR79674.1 NADH dehydrogenase subunit 3 [Cosmoscarta dorsimacula]